MLVSGGQGFMRLEVTYRASWIACVPAMWGCAVCFVRQKVCLFCLFSLPFPPSLVDLVSIGLVSISTDLVSVTEPGGWLPLAELPWIPACSAQGLWLKARCSPWNLRPLNQAPSPSSSVGDEFKFQLSVYLFQSNDNACIFIKQRLKEHVNRHTWQALYYVT